MKTILSRVPNTLSVLDYNACKCCLSIQWRFFMKLTRRQWRKKKIFQFLTTSLWETIKNMECSTVFHYGRLKKNTFVAKKGSFSLTSKKIQVKTVHVDIWLSVMFFFAPYTKISIKLKARRHATINFCTFIYDKMSISSRFYWVHSFFSRPLCQAKLILNESKSCKMQRQPKQAN